MCTVKELIEKLKDFPEDAIVEVLAENTHGYEISTSFTALDVESIDILDFRSEIYVGSFYVGKVFIQLGD
jgi:hypothetical protein